MYFSEIKFSKKLLTSAFFEKEEWEISPDISFVFTF